MRRLIISCVIAATGVCCAVAAATVPGSASPSTTPSTSTATPAQPPPASLTGFLCQRSPTAQNRQIVVIAVMRHVSGTAKMALRFRLLRKRPRQSFANVRFGDLGEWKAPQNDPTLGQQPGDVWRDIKQVVGLSAPATYRFRVSFRWTGSDGSVLQLTTLTSRLCHQP